MNVSFTGIKNIGYEYREYDDGNEDFNDNSTEHFLTVQLTDDFNGKDLTEFRNKVKTSTLKDYYHPINPDLLNICMAQEVISDNIGESTELSIYINDSEDELHIEDKNLSMLSYIAKLLTRISKLPERAIKVDEDYLENDAQKSIILGNDLRADYGEYYDNIIHQVHSADTVKQGAEEMSEILTDKMIDYFS